ncbi:hypothetical protein QWM81_12515 [Streptomyces ficellus]|uniref:Uncharacterized protein n=1 Tax=Streptomyces ficellus TaxID=1977088 RepID=A0ABT7Z5W1_9ACTN|nr:hypothetical protein [Streptomyces ficellus]MDN3294861.1 hypothetical protein [Streptomyces ficellus]
MKRRTVLAGGAGAADKLADVAAFSTSRPPMDQSRRTRTVLTDRDPSASPAARAVYGLLADLWKEAADAMTYVFLAIAAVTAFAGAKKANA